jgi:L-ascorbate metabolism protein UlaG (beta-lactamase superfamily)
MDPDNLEKLDLMLVSHNHIDHWSDPAIKLATRLGTHIVGSKNAVARARRKGLTRLTSLAAGSSCELMGLTIQAVPADHPFAPDAVGFIVAGQQTFYFCGDTRYSPAVKKALEGIHLDVAFLQAACSRYPFVGKDGMELDDIARFASDLRPETIVPVHYQVKGKVISTQDLRAFKLPVRLIVLEPGITSKI